MLNEQTSKLQFVLFLHFFSVNDVEEDAWTDIARNVLSTLEDVMKRIQSDNPSFKGIRYDFGFKCDLCSEEKTPCLRHDKEGCTDDDCVCILSLECLRKNPTFCQRTYGGKQISSRLHETFWLKRRGKIFFPSPRFYESLVS